MKSPKFSLLLTLLILLVSAASAAAATTPLNGYNDRICAIIDGYRSGTMKIGKIKVTKVSANDANKTIRVECNEALNDYPIDTAQLKEIKEAILKALPSKYSSYKVNVTTEKYSLDELAFGTKRIGHGPTETTPFVTRLDNQKAPKGLDGKNIALWQSHGWYFEPKENRWEFQRARVMETVEDLYTQSYVMPFLMPMLENAGAYVMSPRERDINTTEIIVDGDGALAQGYYSETNGKNSWENAPEAGFAYKKEYLREGDNPFRQGKARKVKAVANGEKVSKASWSAAIPETGKYAVYVSYQSLPQSVEDAVYTVKTAAGDRQVKVNQKMGGGTWIYLGHYDLEEGNHPIVELSNLSSQNGVVTADAVKIGGGMGNVERIVKEPQDPNVQYEYVASNYPRFVEGARYFLQWAGAPDSVYTPSENVNDYTDDYRSRGLWVNWLAGGSSVLPNQKGLNIPVDLSLAFHTDAGSTYNDSIVGTLGIYCTVGDTLGNGGTRLLSRDLTNSIMTNIVSDVRTNFEPKWSRRGMWDQSYYEARVPAVPAMLLELLSHQNLSDMTYGHDPAFRFAVSRAIYKGMLKFLAERDGFQYVVQPLPVQTFAIQPTNNNGNYRLSWEEQVDTAEPTAHPSYYIVEQRINDGAFQQVAMVNTNHWEVSISDSDIYSYRVIAGNDGGVSFPSEVLSLCYLPGKDNVLVVNGFTRVSAPDFFDIGSYSGFDDTSDHGVPYIQDIHYIGSQFEFREEIPWSDDDSAGHGASRSNYETTVLPGNTMDFVYVHGRSIKNAGYGFVSSSVAAYASGIYQAASPKNIDLILGKQKEIQRGNGRTGTFFKTFPQELQQRLAAHCKAGGNVFASGAYVASDLWDNPYSTESVREADKAFANEILGFNWRVGKATIEGGVYEVPSRFKVFNKALFSFNQDIAGEVYGVESPDGVYPASKETGAIIMRYSENNIPAGIAMDNGSWRTTVIGFPFETILTPEKRDQMMGQVLNFFNSEQVYKTGTPTTEKTGKDAKKDKKSKKKDNKKSKKSKK